MTGIKAILIMFICDVSNRTRSLGNLPLYLDPVQFGEDAHDIFMQELTDHIRSVVREELQDKGKPIQNSSTGNSGLPDGDKRGKY